MNGRKKLFNRWKTIYETQRIVERCNRVTAVFVKLQARIKLNNDYLLMPESTGDNKSMRSIALRLV